MTMQVSPKDKDLELSRYLIGTGLIWSISAPMSSTITISTFSKLVDPSQQGLYMGIITAAGSAGRIIYPLFADFLPHYLTYIISGASAFLSAVSVAVVSYVMHRVG